MKPKQTHDYLDNHPLKSVLARSITPNQVINPPTKNLVETSGTITRIISPMIISTIPIVAIINSLFSILFTKQYIPLLLTFLEVISN